ncbi:MAG: outer membrane lipoprotein-sorting protein [Candidatus Bipolaricaulota bacterium]|nr:outer membrane lipoprotein-sorting protein [Candidatus Bipolaricaulota bacterium]
MNRRSVPCLLAVLVFAACIACAASAQVDVPTGTPDARAILDQVRTTWQGDSFHAVVRLEITFAGATKLHVLEVWTLGEDYALLRVLEPAADVGSGYLQIGDDLWYYSPTAGKAIKLPSMALGDALFGAGPSLSDLALDTLSEDFDATVEATDGGYSLTLVPHADAPVVYGKLELTVTNDYAIVRLVTYDQRGEAVRTATFSELVDLGGRKVPTLIVLEDTSGDRTVQQITNPEYNLNLDPSFFTLERLEGVE